MAKELPWYEKRKKDITPRNWTSVRDSWLGYKLESPTAGVPPEATVGELPNVQSVLSTVIGHLPINVDAEIEGLHVGLLLEATFLLHKAVHVMGAAQLHVNQGMCTWSLSSAYHAAFFGMKAVLQLLGISIVETDSKTYMLDIWTEPLTKKGRKIPMGELVQVTSIPKIEHRPLWALFSRMLNVTTVEEHIWPARIINAILELQDSDFSRQRNQLHYQVYCWTCDDLHACAVQADFSKIPTDPDSTMIDAQKDNFSIVLSMLVIRMGFELLADLAAKTDVLRPDVDMMKKWFEQDFNAEYLSSFPDAA